MSCYIQQSLPQCLFKLGTPFLVFRVLRILLRLSLLKPRSHGRQLIPIKRGLISLARKSLCDFCIGVTQPKRNRVCITHNTPYSSGPATHSTATSTHSLQFLIPHHHAAVIGNPKISAKQLQSNGRL